MTQLGGASVWQLPSYSAPQGEQTSAGGLQLGVGSHRRRELSRRCGAGAWSSQEESITLPTQSYLGPFSNGPDFGTGHLPSRKVPWRREWQPTPVFLPGEFHEQRSLAGHSSWGSKESDMTERLTLSLSYLPIYFLLPVRCIHFYASMLLFSVLSFQFTELPLALLVKHV